MSIFHEIEKVKELQGLRKNETNDIFDRLAYILPSDLVLVDFFNLRPRVAFNPGAMLRGDKLYLFPRVVIDYWFYASCIGMYTLDIERLIEERKYDKPINVKVLIYPQRLYEFKGCEDACICEVERTTYVLYSGRGFELIDHDHEIYEEKVFEVVATLDEGFNVNRLGYLKIMTENGIFIPLSFKNCVFIKREGKYMTALLRPEVNRKRVCWKGIVDLESLTIDEDTMEIVIPFEDFERKVGWSTNPIKLSSNELLVGWHGVVKYDNSYRFGLAVVDDDGNLLAISNYLLATKGVQEEYGARPLTLFPRGLVKYKEFLIVTSGVGDYHTGIFITEFDKAMEQLKWIKG